LLARFAGHPGIAGARLEQDAAHAGVDAARSQRFADPVLALFRERDTFGGVERDYSGVSLSVQIPLWNLNNGGVTKAVAEMDAARARHDTRARDLDARLRKSHLHLNHLIEQAEHHRTGVLEPGTRLFALTRKSFGVGEVSVLVLVDAHDNYFSARNRYLELLAQQWLEAADLRLAAGQSLLVTEAAP
jgi:outer membrane protein TolC